MYDSVFGMALHGQGIFSSPLSIMVCKVMDWYGQVIEDYSFPPKLKL